MTTLEVGKRLVELCRECKNLDAINELYSEDVVSVEAMATPFFPQKMTGLEAIKAKSATWFSMNEIHSIDADGPFPQDDRFAVRFKFDLTPAITGQRMELDEIAVYTVAEGKIVHEEFFYKFPGS